MTLNWKEALSSLVTKSLSSHQSLEPPFPEELSAIIQERMGFAESEIRQMRDALMLAEYDLRQLGAWGETYEAIKAALRVKP